MASAIKDLRQAEAHDRAGNHEAALAALVAAVKADDPEGMNRLGKRLLAGDRAPLLPKDGVSLLAEAAEKGNAEAPAVLAVLQALGLYQPQSWHDALQSLLLAATRGWHVAQKQLQVLGAPEMGSQERDWPGLAQNIVIADWLEPPPTALTLYEGPLIRSFPGFAPPAVCQWLIQGSRPRLQRALVYDALSRETTVHETRTNSAATLNLIETDLVHVLVQARMAACTGMPCNHLEAAMVLHYAQGEQISEHFDFVDPKVPDYERQIRTSGQRIITFLLYLNDEYQAGETAFPRLGLSHKGRLGEGLFFVNALPDGSADLRTLHAGRPPEGGEKWLVSQFIRNRRVF